MGMCKKFQFCLTMSCFNLNIIYRFFPFADYIDLPGGVFRYKDSENIEEKTDAQGS